MPVELEKIPQKVSLPDPPAILRWCIIIVLITLLGVMLSLWLWPAGISTDSLWFWFCTLALPLSGGVAGYALRLRTYENARDRASYWNHLHQEQHDRQVSLGQRPAGLLGKAFITPNGCNKLAAALLNQGSQLQSQYFSHSLRTLTTARLAPLSTDFSHEGYKKKLAGYITDLLHMLKPELSSLPDGGLSVRIQHDGSLDSGQVIQIWQDAFSAAYEINDLTVTTDGDGMMWLDPWLDRRESAVMLSVEINLFQEPRDYQAESVSALLLTSPEWLTQHDVKPEAVIHRPVVATENISATEDMLRWGALPVDESHTLWRTQVGKDPLTRLIQQAESLGYSPGQDEDYILDDRFGRPGAATGNIALICACEHAITSGKPQWVMAENTTTHQAIVRQAEC